METGQEYVGNKETHSIFGSILKEKVFVGQIGQWKKTKWRLKSEKH